LDKERQMIPPGAARRRRRTARAFPGVQPDVMMITARRNERRAGTEPLLQFKAQHAAIKFQRAFEVGDFQMHKGADSLLLTGSGDKVSRKASIFLAPASVNVHLTAKLFVLNRTCRILS